MDFECSQIMLNVADIDVAREFYLQKLGLPVVENYPKFFACRAGAVRFSVFPGGEKKTDESDAPAIFMLKTADIDATVAELVTRGVVPEDEVREAPGFMRYAPFLDPDGNRFYIAQYMRDPLVAV